MESRTDSKVPRAQGKGVKMEFKTNNGHTFLIDESDYETIKALKPYGHKRTTGHIYMMYDETWRNTGKYVHRLIMDCPKGLVVDHIDGNTLNYQRDNLQCITQSLNMCKMKDRANQSGLRGVYEDKRGRKKPWRAEVSRKGKKVFVKSFYTSQEAGLARDKFLRENYPQCAVYNFDDIV